MEFKYIFEPLYKEPTAIGTHFHNCYELVYYTRARGSTTYYPSSANSIVFMSPTEKSGGETFSFSNNTLVIIPPNIAHDERHCKKNFEPAEIACIGFTASDDESDCPKDVLVYHDTSKRIAEVIDKIKREFHAQSPFYQKIICLQICNILSLVADHTAAAINPDLVIEMAKTYIDEHLNLELNARDLARQFNYSESHFRAIFKQKVGAPIHNYIVDKRIDYAKSLIADFDYSLARISEMCGFGGYLQFHRLFKSREGVSPSDYRLKRGR